MTPTASTKDRVTQALDRQVKEEVTVLSSLIHVQEEFGFLPPESIPLIADYTDASVNDVFGVATFYTHFRFTPPGVHTVEVCWGPSCHVRGAAEVISAVKRELAMGDEGTTEDGEFTWKRSSCAAACAHGPVVVVDDMIYGDLTPEAAIELVKSAR